MTIFDELKEQVKPIGGKCLTCKWIESLPPAEQEDWDIALENREYQVSVVHQVARKHGATFGYESAGRHRREGHRQ